MYVLIKGPGTTTPAQNTPTVLQSIVLPNGLSWDFTYDGFSDLAQITTPTGGTISYNWGITQMCVVGGTYPQNYTSTMIYRSENANDGTGTHTWYYQGNLSQQGQVLTPLTRTVIDPSGNADVYTMTPLGGTCRYYETQVQKYQGSSTSGTLLQTVATNYSYNLDPYSNTAVLYLASVVNVVPMSVTTTWANGWSKQVQKTYDTGFTYYGSTVPGLYGKVMSESDFDYGSGGVGPLLRRTVNNYQAFVNSNYLTYNILAPLASETIYDSASNQCKGVANTYCAYTYFGYDESSLQSSGISTQHDSSPSNGAYRGNVTSVHRWLNGNTVSQSPCNVSVSNGYVVSNKVFFDTGEVQQTSDPCGYATTFLYSSTYAGAFPTTVTNPLSQTTTNTYDFNTGLMVSTTDPNQQQVGYVYDPSAPNHSKLPGWRCHQLFLQRFSTDECNRHQGDNEFYQFGQDCSCGRYGSYISNTAY